MERENTVSAIQKNDTDNPAEVEAADARTLVKTDIKLPHPNGVLQVMNEAPSVSDDEDYDDFDNNDIIFDVIINEANKNEVQVDADEAVEDEEVKNNNDFFEDGNESDNDEYDTSYVRRSTKVRNHLNNLKQNMVGGLVSN